MPLDPQKTKNGIDINEVDLSTMVLVEKKNLLEDLSRQLRATFDEVTDEAVNRIEDAVSKMPTGGSTTSADGPNKSGPGICQWCGENPCECEVEEPKNARAARQQHDRGNSPRSPKKVVDEFQMLRKSQAAAEDMVRKISAAQKKVNKERNNDYIKKNFASPTGYTIASKVDDLANSYSDMDNDELDDAKKQLSLMQEKIRISTFGKEQDILTTATTNLQKALEKESVARGTMLGKMGAFMTKNNINAASILTGFMSRSPLMGLITKYTLDTIREHKQEQKKIKSLTVGDLSKKLVRPPTLPAMDEDNVPIDDATLHGMLAKQTNNEVLHNTLESLHTSGRITTEQYQGARAKMLTPGFVPSTAQPAPPTPTGSIPQPVPGTPAPAAPSAPPAASTPGPNSPTPVDEDEYEPVTDMMGLPVRDWETYRKNTPKNVQKQHEMEGVINSMRERGYGAERRKHAEYLQTEEPEWASDEGLFGPPAPRISMEEFDAKQNAERLQNPYNNPVPLLMRKKVRPAQPTADAATPPPLPTTPERVDNAGNSASSLLNLAENIERAEHEELAEKQNSPRPVLGEPASAGSDGQIGEGPFSKLERLSQLQLEQLQDLNKKVARQIELSDLASDAARRASRGTPDGPDQGNYAQDKSKKGGGIFSALLGGGGGILGGLGGKILTKILGGTKLGKMLGLEKLAGAEGAAGAATKEGMLSKVTGWFRGGKAAGGVAEGAGAAGKAAGVAGEAAEAGGFLSKFGKVGQFLGKAGGITKLLGKLALPLTIIMGVIDFFNGFINAEEFLGMGKKLTILDRVAGGLGGVVKGLVGIVDFVFGLFGVKTDLGGILGKGTAKLFAGVFKVIGAVFNVLFALIKPVFKILGPILEFIGSRIGKTFEILGSFFEGFGTFVEGIADIIGFMFEDDPAKAFVGAIGKLKDGIIGMFGSIVDMIAHMFGFDLMKKAYDYVTESFMSAFKGIGDKIQEMLGPDNFKMLDSILDGIRNFIAAPFKWIAEKLGLTTDGAKTDASKKPTFTTAEKVGMAAATMTGPVGAAAAALYAGYKHFTSTPDLPAPPSAPGAPTITPVARPADPVVTAPVPSTAPAPVPYSTTEETTRVSRRDANRKVAPEETAPTPAPSDRRETQSVGSIVAQASAASLFNNTLGSRSGNPYTSTATRVAGSMGGFVSGKTDVTGNIGLIASELQRQGMNPKEIAAILANVEKESGFSTKGENLNYGGTSNARIRSIFGAERTNMSDSDLDMIKKDPAKFGEAMYGKTTKIGRGMGNTEEGDGYKFRGRGFIQLTGRSNYAKASKEIFGDDRLTQNPDMVSDPAIAAKITAWYTDSRGKQMAKRMGIDLKNGSQADVNLAYTSAIAGTAIKPGQGYLGGEVMGKVNNYSSKYNGTQFNPANMPPPNMQQGTGVILAKAQNEARELERMKAAQPTQTASVVSAPTTVTTNNTSVQSGVLRAGNTENTYKRVMNSTYVGT